MPIPNSQSIPSSNPCPLVTINFLRCNEDPAQPKINLTKINDGEGDGTPLQSSCLENPTDGGAWWAAVYWVTQCWTRLK